MLGKGVCFYLIWSQAIVCMGVINLWEVPQLTSWVLPLPPFLGEARSTQRSTVFTGNTNKRRKQKTKGKNSRRSYLHGLSIFHKHMAIMTTAWGPWTCRGSRMLAPFSLCPCCCWLLPFTGAEFESQKIKRGQLIPPTSGICIRKALIARAAIMSMSCVKSVTSAPITVDKVPTAGPIEPKKKKIPLQLHLI